MQTEDGYLIRKCINGEPEAFGLLVDKYKACIFAFVYAKLRNFHDSEDITQEVFIKAYKNIRNLRHWDSFLAWLYCIASNLCKNWLKSESRRRDNQYIEDQPSRVMESASIDSSQSEFKLEMIRDALDSLPEIYQQVLTLHYLGGMSGEEISKFLRVPHATIRQRLSRARDQLREEVTGMMDEVFKQHKLQAGFTFRIVEIVKKIKFYPMPHVTSVPWGLSLATGIILVALSVNPNFSFISQPSPSIVSSASSSKINIMPSEVSVHILNIPQNLYVKQGKGDKSGLSDHINMDTQTEQSQKGKWRKMADMPMARHGLTAGILDGKAYFIGGAQNAITGYSVYSTFYEYDLVSGVWKRKADMPTTRYGMCCGVVNGKIYVIGGAYKECLSVVEEYDPARDKWTRKSDMPTARYYLSASVVNGKIYVIGGAREYLDRDEVTIYSTVEEYDPVTDSWSSKADMPTPRGGLSTCVVNGKIYAIGGSYQRHGLNDYTGLPTVEEYDPIADVWTKKADMPTARLGLATCAVNGKIYAIGGINRGTVFDVVEEYDPIRDKWTKRDDMPTARAVLSVYVYNGKIYAFGGASVDFVSVATMEEYDPGINSENDNRIGKRLSSERGSL